MGDWSNNLEYEHREYYGHFYDTDEDVHEEETEEMTTVEILKEMAFTATETQRRALEDAISALSENKGKWIEVVTERFPNGEKRMWHYECSACSTGEPPCPINKEHWDFCPNCGADMRGE